jgi:hypothetical protein
MKKFLIDESQKEEILKKHQDFKKSLSETVIKRIYNSKKILKEESDPIFIDNRTIEQVKADCVTDPTVKAIITSIEIKGKRIPGIKVNGGPDNVRIYTNEKNEMFGGYNWYVLNTAETKILKGPYKWTCPAKKGPDPNASDIENLLNSGVWFKKEDLAKQGISEDELSSNWTQHPKYKNLYKRQGVGPSKSTGFTSDQKAFVKAWMENPEVADNINRNIFKINPTAEDFASGQWRVDNYFIADNSENYFPADSKGVKGLKVYFNNARVIEDLTRGNCKAKIKQFVDAYKMRASKPQSTQWISSNRAFVQQCADRFKFGGPLSNMDNDLNLVGGMIEGGAGSNSPWHINLNKKLK